MSSTIFQDYSPSTPIVSAWLNDVNAFVYCRVVGGGTGNAITLTYSPAIAAIPVGQRLRFTPLATNTGATTIKVNSLGAATCYGQDNAALIGGELLINSEVEVVWNGSAFYIVSGQGGTWQVPAKSYAKQTTTTATDANGVLHLTRATSHTGGTPGFVCSTLRTDTTVTSSAVTNFEWGATFVMNNYASAGENVASYSQGNRYGTGPTWAGVMEVHDQVGTNNPTNLIWGLEVDNWGNGTDNNNVKQGIAIFAGKTNAGAANEVYAGLSIAAEGGLISNGYFKNGIVIQNCSVNGITMNVSGTDGMYVGGTFSNAQLELTGTSTYGILGTNTGTWGALFNGTNTVGVEVSGAPASGSFRLAAESFIAFDASSVNKFGYFGTLGGLGYVTSGVIRNGFRSSGNVYFTGQLDTASAGNTSATAGSHNTYLKIVIDGNPFKIDILNP